jgi:hypothetical protein
VKVLLGLIHQGALFSLDDLTQKSFRCPDSRNWLNVFHLELEESGLRYLGQAILRNLTRAGLHSEDNGCLLLDLVITF